MPEFLMSYLPADDEDDGGTPFPTEYPQWEIERIARFYCADKIARQEPVKICYISEQPHVVTGFLGTGPSEVTAYPILPLENVTESGAAELRKKGQFYIGKEVNCGSKKNPEIWVIVGPENTLTIAAAADLPDNQIEAKDDFTAVRCDECGRIEGGHAPTCSLSGVLTYENYLDYAQANNIKNPKSYARKMDLNRDPETDAKVREWLASRAAKALEATA